MCSRINFLIIPFAFVLRIPAVEPVSNRAGNAQASVGRLAETVADELVGSVVDILCCRALKQSAFRKVELEKTTLVHPSVLLYRRRLDVKPVFAFRPRPDVIGKRDIHSMKCSPHLVMNALSDEQSHHNSVWAQEELEAYMRRQKQKSKSKESWFPVESSLKLANGVCLPFDLFNETWVLFRGKDGRPVCLRDVCAHRACPLSLGKVVAGEISCPYHGWRFNEKGMCTAMPSTVFVKGISVDSLPTTEANGQIWVYPGIEKPPDRVPSSATKRPRSF